MTVITETGSILGVKALIIGFKNHFPRNSHPPRLSTCLLRYTNTEFSLSPRDRPLTELESPANTNHIKQAFTNTFK